MTYLDLIGLAASLYTLAAPALAAGKSLFRLMVAATPKLAARAMPIRVISAKRYRQLVERERVLQVVVDQLDGMRGDATHLSAKEAKG
jgi:uncharacterized tellurite resistance protein B-like protein